MKSLKTHAYSSKTNVPNQLEYSFLLACAWVFNVFEVNSFKTHAHSSKNGAHGVNTREKRLKPTRRTSTSRQKTDRRSRRKKDSWTAPAPAMRNLCSHAPTQLRLARTHERIEIEINFLVPGGGGQAGLTPPKPPTTLGLVLILHAQFRLLPQGSFERLHVHIAID